MNLKAVSASLCILAAAFACAQTDPASLAIANLQTKPNDAQFLAQIKAAIPVTTNADDQCFLGVVYALGCLASGNTNEGLAVRSQVLRTFPGKSWSRELADATLMERCAACDRGEIRVPCAACAGLGTCAKCQGTGKETTAGLGKPRNVRCIQCRGGGVCRTCAGLKTVLGTCAICRGTGLLASPAKVTAAYLRMLSAGQ